MSLSDNPNLTKKEKEAIKDLANQMAKHVVKKAKEAYDELTEDDKKAWMLLIHYINQLFDAYKKGDLI